MVGVLGVLLAAARIDSGVVSCGGEGGMGSAFEKRERPPVLGANSVAVFHSMMNNE